jgi:hypothetical protein
MKERNPRFHRGQTWNGDKREGARKANHLNMPDDFLQETRRDPWFSKLATNNFEQRVFEVLSFESGDHFLQFAKAKKKMENKCI